MTFQIKKISGEAIRETGLDDRIIEFDRTNMAAVLEEAGQSFSEEKRRLAFDRSPTILVAFRDQRIIGYLEYCRSQDNVDEFYLSALQVAPGARGGAVLLSLLRSAHEDLVNEDFERFISAVHKNNLPAIQLYRKLGFAIEEVPGKEKSFAVTASRDILFNDRLLRLFQKVDQMKGR